MTSVFAYNLENVEVDPIMFDGSSVDNIDYRSLLFQTGYLTITAQNPDRGTVILNYPNKEVKDALLKYALGGYANRSHADSQISALDLRDALLEGNIERFKNTVNALFASIPYDIFLKNYEAYYQSVLYIALQLLGILVKCEVHTNKGRIDTVIHFPNRIYIVEFKIEDSAAAAIAQIKEKQYAAPYLATGKQITLIGVGLSKEDKAISSILIE